MRTLARLAALLALTAVGALPAQAQLTELQPGTRVRVEASGIVAGRYVGTVLASTADTMTIGSPDRLPLAIPTARISAIEVSRGKSKMEGAKRGVLWGAPIGLALGAFAAAMPTCDRGRYNNCDDYPTDVEFVVGNLVGSVVIGAGIGALIGREKWERFQLRPSAAIDIRNGMATLRFSYRLDERLPVQLYW